MPLILTGDYEKAWIDPDLTAEKAYGYLRPVDEKQMSAHTISKLISKRGVDKNVPGLVEPFSYDNGGFFPSLS